MLEVVYIFIAERLFLINNTYTHPPPPHPPPPPLSRSTTTESSSSSVTGIHCTVHPFSAITVNVSSPYDRNTLYSTPLLSYHSECDVALWQEYIVQYTPSQLSQWMCRRPTTGIHCTVHPFSAITVNVMSPYDRTTLYSTPPLSYHSECDVALWQEYIVQYTPSQLSQQMCRRLTTWFDCILTLIQTWITMILTFTMTLPCHYYDSHVQIAQSDRTCIIGMHRDCIVDGE